MLFEQNLASSLVLSGYMRHFNFDFPIFYDHPIPTPIIQFFIYFFSKWLSQSIHSPFQDLVFVYSTKFFIFELCKDLSWCFLQFKEFELNWGAVFSRLEEEYWRSLFLINFIGVIFEAGNETREKIWSDFGAEQK